MTPFGEQPVSQKKIISASNVANVLGRGYITREKYLRELFDLQPNGGFKPESNDFEISAKLHGKKYESRACQHFLAKMDPIWKPMGSINEQYTHSIDVLINNGESRFTVAATPDLIMYDEQEQKFALLEIKCPYHRYITKSSIRDEESANLLLSDKHYVQCQMQMLVTAIPEVYLFFYIPSPDEDPDNLNACIFKILPDTELHKFLISNIFIAINEGEEKFKLMMREGAHNAQMIYNSKIHHATFLIP